MPLVTHPPCPSCGKPLIRKPAGRCPECGTAVAAYVSEVRDREERVEKIAAVVSTILVVAVFLWTTGGLGVIEGALAYAIAGAVVWVVAQKTFFAKKA
jgi:peptidoglycan/LPS O-acetylase OafA/YrhL